MTPEISHRCSSCGVSVRERDALFCPECGESLAAPPKGSDSIEAVEPLTAKAGADAESASESLVDEPAPSASVVSETPAEAEGPPLARVYSKDDDQTARRRGEKTRERLHRASEVARGVTRGVIEEPAKRVEKIRQASTVVIEEASYDPSLRFVIVALGLFVVFVILLIVSKVMG